MVSCFILAKLSSQNVPRKNAQIFVRICQTFSQNLAFRKWRKWKNAKFPESVGAATINCAKKLVEFSALKFYYIILIIYLLYFNKSLMKFSINHSKFLSVHVHPPVSTQLAMSQLIIWKNLLNQPYFFAKFTCFCRIVSAFCRKMFAFSYFVKISHIFAIQIEAKFRDGNPSKDAII